jgi:protein-S-isoprenylcysteine O-methyltransferase Ste14
MIPMQIVLTAIVTALLQLGLAILGWGGFGPFFAHPALIALVAMTAVLVAVALFSEGNVSRGVREDRGNRWVFAFFAVLALLLAYVPAYTDRQGIWVIDGETTRWVGVALGIVGGVLRLWPVFVLGRRFSGLVAIQEGHELVTSGIYRVLRHPSYLGLLVGSLGWALAFRSIIGVIITALFLIPLIARMNAEERLLAGAFGADYAAYRARTKWRLLPGVY